MPFHESYEITFQQIINTLEKRKVKLIFYQNFYLFVKSKKIKFQSKIECFENYTTLKKINNIFCFLSVGGDGTFLNAITFIRDLKIPILGLNTGRLGFISSVATYQIYDAINHLLNNNFFIKKRTLLTAKTKNKLFGDTNFALNEISVIRKDTSSMIKIHAYLNDEFLNTYWADGLIISTPTGSTGYSLSSGGPILVPETNNLVITPVAPHNLNVRPIVISNKNKIKLTVEDRDEFVSLIEIKIETGRRHQIRMAMQFLGCPIVGDTVHGATTNPLNRICLHATSLGFLHPSSDKFVLYDSNVPFANRDKNNLG